MPMKQFILLKNHLLDVWYSNVELNKSITIFVFLHSVVKYKYLEKIALYLMHF